MYNVILITHIGQLHWVLFKNQQLCYSRQNKIFSITIVISILYFNYLKLITAHPCSRKSYADSSLFTTTFSPFSRFPFKGLYDRGKMPNQSVTVYFECVCENG